MKGNRDLGESSCQFYQVKTRSGGITGLLAWRELHAHVAPPRHQRTPSCNVSPCARVGYYTFIYIVRLFRCNVPVETPYPLALNHDGNMRLLVCVCVCLYVCVWADVHSYIHTKIENFYIFILSSVFFFFLLPSKICKHVAIIVYYTIAHYFN